MSSQTFIDERTSEQVRALSMTREGPVLARLREETTKMPRSQMQISPEQGRFMALLVDMLGAKHCLEIGVFTGYSAICVAQRLPADGKLIACDVSEEWTSIAKRYWQEAGVANRIELRLGPASETLAAMIKAGESDRYDFAFIDADKEGYDDYYDKCLVLVRKGGVIAIDNIFMRGRTFDPANSSAGPSTVRALTTRIFADKRVEPSLVPISDGVLLARKR
jgi:predicted O-methyltransferase YrrM